MKMTVQELVDLMRDEMATGNYEPAHIDSMDDKAAEIVGVFNLANVVRKINERADA